MTTITSFYSFNHHIPGNWDAKALSYVIAKHPVYNIYDIYHIYSIYTHSIYSIQIYNIKYVIFI